MVCLILGNKFASLIIVGIGSTVGAAMSAHPQIMKIAFTGSTLTGRKILKASAESNLKKVTLELGGKSPTIIFDDADLEQAIKWASSGILCVYISLSLSVLYTEPLILAGKLQYGYDILSKAV